MKKVDDCKQFPIQQHYDRETGKEYPACFIPWWLAELAYKKYVELYGSIQSLERLAERKGFGRVEFLQLLRTKPGKQINWNINYAPETRTGITSKKTGLETF